MARPRRHTGTLLAAIAVSATLTACASLPRPATTERGTHPAAHAGSMITQEEIARSGARDAFQAIERGGTYLTIADTGGNRPVRISRRGASSIAMSNAVLLVVDGTPVQHTEQVLRSIPAASIHYIHVLSGRDASVRWGSQAANGVVVVATSAR